MAKLLFIHGLNTYGDDDIHLGPLRFGPMHAHVEAGLKKRGIDFLAPTAFAAVSAPEEAENILRQLRTLDFWDDRSEKFDLLGNSAGGLAARALAAHPEMIARVRLLITYGTPHRGTVAADLADQTQKSWLHRAFTLSGFANTFREKKYAEFKKISLEKFNSLYPKHPFARELSLLCQVPPQEISLPLRLLFHQLHPPKNHVRPESDGFIWSESQRFGEVLGPFALDHLGEMGFFPFLRPSARRRARSEFDRLLDTIAQLVSKEDAQASWRQNS